MIAGLTNRVENYSSGIDATKLNTLDVWIPDSASEATDIRKQWVIYIHGGAWRDPDVDSESFVPALRVLWKSPSQASFAGFVSINYSLSPYPSHDTNPSTPNDPSRNVHHPRHLLDIAHALSFLQERYNIRDRYILVGHSAGATLTFQLHQALLPGKSLPQPSKVLGISGIYNFEAFLDAHSGIEAYKEIMENAFPERAAWQEASPYSSTLKSTLWGSAGAIAISHSQEDELVEDAQASFMLERARSSSETERKVYFLEASGHHNQIWSSGTTLASLIIRAMDLPIVR